MCPFCDGYPPDQVHRALDLRILTDGAGTWLQVVPPPDWFCSCHREEHARLHEPEPWIGTTTDDPPPRRRPPNRAERRAHMKRRRW